MSQAHYLLDSDILIEYLRGRAEAQAFFDNLLGIRSISVVSVAELFAGTRNAREAADLEVFLNVFEQVPVSAVIARTGGALRHAYRESHGTGLAAALIAATALELQATLVTFNQRHFPMLESVLVPYPRGAQ